MSRIKAFTIMEMLVGMAVTSLVAVAAWTAWDMMSRQQISFMKQNREVKSLQMLDARLAEDFDRCLRAVKTENGLLLLLNGREINYRFTSNAVLRCDENGCDSLKCQGGIPAFEFAGKPVTMNDSLIDKLHFIATCQNEEIRFDYGKKYAAAVFFTVHPSR